MKYAAVILFLIALFDLVLGWNPQDIAKANANSVAWPGFLQGRIINGVEATPGEAPYIVSLQTLKKDHFCAGSLITDRVVLTAAHCLNKISYLVVAGAHRLSDAPMSQVRRGSYNRQVLHEQFAFGVISPYDLGLVFVDEPFILNSGGSAPVSTIYIPEGQFLENTKGILYGWGSDNSGYLSNKLQKLDVNIVSYRDCKEALPSYSGLHHTNICSHTPGSNDGACDGDSGGPMVNRRSDGTLQIVGIVSWGYIPCTSNTYPTVYTHVGAYTEWVLEHYTDM